MKSEVLVPVAAAVIAAVASIGGVLYSQRMALESEKLKYQISRAEDARKSTNQALADFAKEFAAAYQRSSYILWLAEMRSHELKPSDFRDYDRESKNQFPKLVAAQILLATHSKELYEVVDPELRAYWKLDENISVAGNRLEKDRAGALKDLTVEVHKIRELEKRLLAALITAGEKLSKGHPQ